MHLSIQLTPDSATPKFCKGDAVCGVLSIYGLAFNAQPSVAATFQGREIAHTRYALGPETDASISIKVSSKLLADHAVAS